VSFKDSDLSTDHSAQLLAYKNLTLKHTVVVVIISSSIIIITIIITSEMYLSNRRMPVNL